MANQEIGQTIQAANGSGSTKSGTGNNVFQSQVLAYDELINIAKAIADKLSSFSLVVIHDQTGNQQPIKSTSNKKVA